MRNEIRFPLVLVLISAFAAADVGSLYVITGEKIQQSQKKREDEALDNIFGAGILCHPLTKTDDPLKQVYEIRAENNEPVGYAAIAEGKGYSSGPIRVLVGMDPTRSNARGIGILRQEETPGLGTRIVEVETKKTWPRVIVNGITGRKIEGEEGKPLFLEQFKGKQKDEVRLRSRPTEKGIDSITGATKSSRGAVDAVNEAIQRIEEAPIEKTGE